MTTHARPPGDDTAPDAAPGGAARGGAAAVWVEATVRVGGAVDPRRTDEVRGWIRGLRAAGVRHLVVDVSAAGDRDAGLLGVLARTRAGLVAAGGTLRVTGVALPQFLVALQHAELDEVFVVYDALRRGRAATGRPVHPAVSSPG